MIGELGWEGEVAAEAGAAGFADGKPKQVPCWWVSRARGGLARKS